MTDKEQRSEGAGPLLVVVVKTRMEFQTERKGLKVPKVEGFTIRITDRMSGSLQIILALAFLGSIVFSLVAYKALTYDHACPDGFIDKHKRCVPASLKAYAAISRGRLYTVISRTAGPQWNRSNATRSWI